MPVCVTYSGILHYKQEIKGNKVITVAQLMRFRISFNPYGRIDEKAASVVYTFLDACSMFITMLLLRWW
jgi:hypothetical protein